MGEQQTDRRGRIIQAAGGIDPGGQAEGHASRPQATRSGQRNPRHVGQCPKAGTGRPGKLDETMLHQDPVLAQQGDQVGDGAQGDEIQEGPQLLSRLPPEERLQQLERNPHPAQALERVGAVRLSGIEDRGGGG